MARPGLSDHRKFRRLERALKSKIAARGVLELLWEVCYESGEAIVGTAEDIEHAVGWSGEAGVLTAALAEAGAPTGAGFIERVEGTGEPVYRVHDLWHHAPDYVLKRRRREIDRQRRSDPTTPVLSQSGCPPNGGRWPTTSDCQAGDVRPPSPSPSPSPSHEKSAEAFLVFPTVGVGGTSWTLTQDQCAEWAALFPHLDVRSECRKALAWIEANPGRRKTGGGMPRFLAGWLSRAVDRGHAPGYSAPPTRAPGRWDDWLSKCTHTPKCGSASKCDIQQRLEAGRKTG